MFRRLFTIGGTATLAAAAMLMTPDLSLAQRRGGGSREGGGSHAGGGRESGGNWQYGREGGGSWQQSRADGWRGGYGGYGYGWNYPGYYNGTSQYYETQPGYYSNEAIPEYADSAPIAGDRIYGASARTTEDSNAVRVELRVPADAKVSFEGEKTIQTGNWRRYVSPPITPGENYTYDIQANWMENGRQVTRTRHVPVHAGQMVRVDFLRRESSDEATDGVAPPRGNTTDRGNLPGTTTPDSTVVPGTPRTQTTPGDRGNLPGTTPPVSGTNPPPAFAGQSVSAAEKSHDGKIVKAGDGKLTMTDTAGKNKHTHDVAADAKITCDGKEVKLADLKAGDSVTVTTNTDDKDTTLAIKIEARFAAEKSHEGKIVKAGDGKLIMTDADGANNRTVNVANEATITCEGKEVKLAELKNGDFVKVTTKTDDKDVTVVTKIESRAREIGSGS